MSEYYPVTHPQKRVLDAELIDQGSDKYVILSTYNFKKSGPDVFGAVQSVFLTCPDLNLRFHVSADGVTLRQYHGKPDMDRIRLLDFAGREAERKKWIDRYVAQPFDPFMGCAVI